MAEAAGSGRVDAIFRYPIKSMAGESLAAAEVGWHGVDGDRRLALRRRGVGGGKPWLTASTLPELLRFTPVRHEAGLPTHVRTPDGRELEVGGDELAAEISRAHGKPVQMMRLDHGMFDEGTISVITTATIGGIAAACERELDVRRFRPNLVIHTDTPRVFEEDGWVGGIVSFGDDGIGPELAITQRDLRCVMLDLDPDSAESDPRVMKTVVRLNDNHAGVYATVTRQGRVSVGDRVRVTLR